MKLDRVEIKNFRSIQGITLNFDLRCRVLVGINESGKSNILDALALLGSDRKPVPEHDLREALPNEDPIKDSYIMFVFKFEEKESDRLLESVLSKILTVAKDPDIVSISGKNEKISKFCAAQKEGLYIVDITEETRYFQYWELASEYQLIAGWKKPTADCPADFPVKLRGLQYTLAEYKLVHAAALDEIPEGYLEDASIEDLSELFGGVIRKIAKENLPDILFWKYEKGNLLPGNVDIANFSSDPDSCVPLKNMFTLAGIKDIKADIDKERAGGDNRFQNYLDRVAKKTTNHFRSVWKNYKNIEFSLKTNVDQIRIGIKDKNTYDFARRSDGFKRFVTFLLMISVNVKTDNLHDTLLLIDEPDIGLHPSGARYLRDELIRISKTNYVVYSTHSIFMIDRRKVGRHFIVKKEDEITSIELGRESNIAKEEVLLNALEYSVFSTLREKNLIFEGWNDQRLFHIALKSIDADLKQKYKDVGDCYAGGVTRVRAITPILELAKRKCIIISDSDTVAKNHQKQYQKDKGFGDWKTYQDVDPTIEAVTGEDFVRNAFIAKQVKTVLHDTTMPLFDETTLPDKRGKLTAIFKWLLSKGMEEDEAKGKITEIKSLIFEKLKPTNIDMTEYTKLLKGISL